MKNKTLTIYKEDCCGCHACEVACKQEHQLGVGPRLIRVNEKTPFFIPIYCHHCAKPPCRDVCPVEAIYRNDQGVVLIKEEDCIGCRECLTACPFGAMQFDEEKETAVKCDLCLDRIQQGLPPACSQICPTRCIFWGETTVLLDKMAAEQG
ncbi:MAG: 4Fe-4S dicluster domain-containing protein [Thermodesulfobacteriota bacterium]